MQELLEKVQKENKICYIMGDFNINLLNYDKHKQTTYFVDILYFNSFLPVINRPTRINVFNDNFTATLIDNIVTNDIG